MVDIHNDIVTERQRKRKKHPFHLPLDFLLAIPQRVPWDKIQNQ